MQRLSSKQFGLYFLVLTAGLALMIPNLRWLNVVSVGVLLVATGAVRGWKISNQIGRVLLVVTIAIFIGNRAQQRGEFWSREPQPTVELVAIFVSWLLGVSIEYRAWRKALAGSSAA